VKNIVVSWAIAWQNGNSTPEQTLSAGGGAMPPGGVANWSQTAYQSEGQNIAPVGVRVTNVAFQYTNPCH
jgi:hypothetical protein